MHPEVGHPLLTTRQRMNVRGYGAVLVSEKGLGDLGRIVRPSAGRVPVGSAHGVRAVAVAATAVDQCRWRRERTVLSFVID
jgi:hypothetical protein